MTVPCGGTGSTTPRTAAPAGGGMEQPTDVGVCFGDSAWPAAAEGCGGSVARATPSRRPASAVEEPRAHGLRGELCCACCCTCCCSWRAPLAPTGSAAARRRCWNRRNCSCRCCSRASCRATSCATLAWRAASAALSRACRARRPSLARSRREPERPPEPPPAPAKAVLPPTPAPLVASAKAVSPAP